MTISKQELKDKIAAYVPGHETQPAKIPQGLIPDHFCVHCNGTGWKQSSRAGRYFICPCSIEKHMGATHAW